MTDIGTAEGQSFLADIADKLESAATNLDSQSEATGMSTGNKKCSFRTANFPSKLVYTACYTLSYGICFPIFVACHYIPKNNRFVEGLVDGQASANQSVNDMLSRVKANRLTRQNASEESTEMDEILEAGASALEPA